MFFLRNRAYVIVHFPCLSLLRTTIITSSLDQMSIPSAGVGSLSTLLKRLEAATSRLEDIALAQAPLITTASSPSHIAAAPSTAAAAAALTASSQRSVSSAAPVPAGSPAPSAPAQEKSAAVAAFEEILQVALTKYMGLSREMGGLVLQQVCHAYHGSPVC